MPALRGVTIPILLVVAVIIFRVVIIVNEMDVDVVQQSADDVRVDFLQWYVISSTPLAGTAPLGAELNWTRTHTVF